LEIAATSRLSLPLNAAGRDLVNLDRSAGRRLHHFVARIKSNRTAGMSLVIVALAALAR
jgi:hypothetical protein